MYAKKYLTHLTHNYTKQIYRKYGREKRKDIELQYILI